MSTLWNDGEKHNQRDYTIIEKIIDARQVGAYFVPHWKNYT
ncbi:MAG: hypothetical protein ACREXR_13455 [Gammaproteobacteria bacterium]